MMQLRWAAAAGIAGGLLQTVGGVVETVDRVLPGEPGFVPRTSIIGIAYLMLAGAVLGVGALDVAAPRRYAWIGLGVAAFGWLLSAVAQFVLQIDFDLAVAVLFPLSNALIGIGMLTVGVLALRARRWRGWRLATPLICGLYPFLVIVPVFAANGGPVFLVLSGWGACWMLLGLAMWSSIRVSDRAPGAQAAATKAAGVR